MRHMSCLVAAQPEEYSSNKVHKRCSSTGGTGSLPSRKAFKFIEDKDVPLLRLRTDLCQEEQTPCAKNTACTPHCWANGAGVAPVSWHEWHYVQQLKRWGKCTGVPAGSFSNCKLKQMNIAFVLRCRREDAQATTTLLPFPQKEDAGRVKGPRMSAKEASV